MQAVIQQGTNVQMKQSPIYRDLDKLKAWIERTYGVKIVGTGVNYRGWPSFSLSDGRHIEYEDIRWSKHKTPRLLKKTKYTAFGEPREYPDWAKKRFAIG